MKRQKKSIKKVLVMLIAIICNFAITIPTFAASEEYTLVSKNNNVTRAVHTFGPGLNQTVGSFTFSNYNWTPIKTISGTSTFRRFYFNGYFKKADSYNGLVKLTLKVKRVSDGKIIFNKVFEPNTNGEGLFCTDVFYADLNGYDQVQLYFDASTYNATPPGPYRSLYVSYDCSVY